MRGDLLAKLGRLADARTEFERAASLTRNERERALLTDRAAACTTDRPAVPAGPARTTTAAGDPGANSSPGP